MAGKDNTRGKRRGEAVQVFRQFAWNLAGTLAGGKAAGGRARPRPAKTPAAR